MKTKKKEIIVANTKNNGKLPHLLIPSKSATLFPDFVVEDLPLGRTATLVSEFGSERPALGENILMMMNQHTCIYGVDYEKCVLGK